MRQEWIVLLRGINVGGHRKVPMAELRELAEELGFTEVRTYLNSGNLLAMDDSSAVEIRRRMEDGLLERFGFEVDVVVRSAEQICEVAERVVFSEAQEERANLVHVVFSPEPVAPDCVSGLADYLSEVERAEVVGDELWVDFAGGSGRSKVTPDVLRRAVGQLVTARNFRTVRKLAGMVRGD